MGEKGGSGIELSYVLPTYNRAEYLGECLWTLMEQDYDKDKYEVIVVDDGSTDTTEELMSYFLKEFPSISYHVLSHGGVEKARNFGNSIAQASLIGVCDSDDLYHDKRTQLTIDYFNKHPEVDIVNGSYQEIDHRGMPIKFYQAKELDKEVFLAGNQAYFCHDNSAYRKDKILKIPYREEGQQTDDWKLVHDWVKAGYVFGTIQEELCKVRTLNNGIMGARRKARGVNLSYAK